MHYFSVVGGAQPEPIFAFSKKKEAEGKATLSAWPWPLKAQWENLKKTNRCIDKGRMRGYTE